MAELFLELFSEEIPARMQSGAAEQLYKAFSSAVTGNDRLSEKIAAFTFSKDQVRDISLKTYITPRRLVLIAQGLPTKGQDIKVEHKGPRVDAADRKSVV